jgi:RNA polymerase sigma factor (sigma-70 family)
MDNQNNPEIFDEEFINKVYMYCYKHFFDSEKVQDLAQDILLEAVAAKKSGRDIKNFYAWFWQMAHNKIVAYIKLKNNEAVSLESFIGTPRELADETEVDKNLLREEEITELKQAVENISKIHKEVIIMYYLEQKTIKEIAGVLSVPEGTVKRRLHDAKKEIRINMS